MILTQEQRIKNLSLWVKKLTEIGVNTNKLIEMYGDKIQNSPLSDKPLSGMAYEGALIYQALFKLTPHAININNKLTEDIRVDKNTLIKVCLLINLAKSIMFESETENWKITKGAIWKYVDYPLALRTGQRTLLMLQECEIELTDNEIEAILGIDALDDDTFIKTNGSTLLTVVRLANQLMWHETTAMVKLKNRDKNNG
jgi:hypothetical protein